MPHWLKLSSLAVFAAATMLAFTQLGDEQSPQTASSVPPAPALTMVQQAGRVGIGGDADSPLRAPLRALLETMESGRAEATSTSLALQGVAISGSEFGDSLAAFRRRMHENAAVSVDVYVIDSTLSVDALCTTMFASIIDASVKFHESGTEMRSASYPVLDRLVDFARDCPQKVIEITGHSDATGPESFNRDLSQRRADAAANYLTARGIEPERLTIRGAGSAEPIADNATILGRERNRRIEFALVP